MLRIAASVLPVAGTGAGEGRAVSGDALTPLGVDAPPDKGVDALSDKGVDAPPDKGVDAPPDKGVGTPPDKGVDTPPDKGVDAPPDKGSCTSLGKDSAGAIRVARLLLALSLDVTATDDEAVRAFSTGSSSFAIPNVSLAAGFPKETACSARGVNGQGRVLHPSFAAGETGPSGRAPFSSSTRALAGLVAGWSSARGVNGQGSSPLLLLYSGFGGLGRRLELSTRSKWPWVNFPPLRRCCQNQAKWPGPLLLLCSGFGGLGRRLNLSRQE